MAGRIERGEIRLYAFPAPDKPRPVLVLTRVSAIDYLSRVTVAPITSAIRGVPSEVVVGLDDGLKQPCAIQSTQHRHGVEGWHRAPCGAARGRPNARGLPCACLRARLLEPFQLTIELV